MTSPVYNPNAPLPNDIIAKSQVDFLNNFSTLADAFKKNHVALDALANAGNHTVIQMLEQNTNAQFQTNTGEISIYAKNVENQTDQIFLRYQGNQTEFQYSNYQIYQLEPGFGLIPFFTTLPGGIIIYFGLLNIFSLAQLQGNLTLFPYISKNIISANFCAAGTTPGFGLSYSVNAAQNGTYNSIKVYNPLFSPPVPSGFYYYTVVANT